MPPTPPRPPTGPGGSAQPGFPPPGGCLALLPVPALARVHSAPARPGPGAPQAPPAPYLARCGGLGAGSRSRPPPSGLAVLSLRQPLPAGPPARRGLIHAPAPTTPAEARRPARAGSTWPHPGAPAFLPASRLQRGPCSRGPLHRIAPHRLARWPGHSRPLATDHWSVLRPPHPTTDHRPDRPRPPPCAALPASPWRRHPTAPCGARCQPQLWSMSRCMTPDPPPGSQGDFPEVWPVARKSWGAARWLGR